MTNDTNPTPYDGIDAQPNAYGLQRRALLRTGALGLGGAATGLITAGATTSAASANDAVGARGAGPTLGNSSTLRASLPVSSSAAPTPATPPAPLFDDPLYSGASDPTIVFNRGTNEWWMFYTQRRAFNPSGGGVAWVHGSDIGIASSTDGGVTWLYRGVAQGLEYEPGRNTYWAPEIVWNAGEYHMFVVFIRGVPNTWSWNRDIIHYTSKDLLNWKLVGAVPLETDKVIDACVYPVRSAHGKTTWRMWYKDEGNGSHIYAAESTDLYQWTVVGPVLTNHHQEGPQVFELGGTYWMITDPDASGLDVYSSADLISWTAQDALILADMGSRNLDNATGHHCFVMTQQDSAYIVYFTQFDRSTYIQVAPLVAENGVLSVDRNTPFTMAWVPELASALRGGQLPTPSPS